MKANHKECLKLILNNQAVISLLDFSKMNQRVSKLNKADPFSLIGNQNFMYIQLDTRQIIVMFDEHSIYIGDFKLNFENIARYFVDKQLEETFDAEIELSLFKKSEMTKEQVSIIKGYMFPSAKRKNYIIDIAIPHDQITQEVLNSYSDILKVITNVTKVFNKEMMEVDQILNSESLIPTYVELNGEAEIGLIPFVHLQEIYANQVEASKQNS